MIGAVPPKRSLSLVVPMFNEEENIEHALAWAVDALERHCDDFEILVVDDAVNRPIAGSRAGAPRAGDPRIKVIRHPVNRKLGGSLKTGFAAASKGLVLYMDADLPFDPRTSGGRSGRSS